MPFTEAGVPRLTRLNLITCELTNFDTDGEDYVSHYTEIVYI